MRMRLVRAALTARRVQAALAVASIGVAVAVAVALVLLVTQVRAGMAGALRAYGPNLVATGRMDEASLRRAASVLETHSWAPVLAVEATAGGRGVAVIGVPPEALPALKPWLGGERPSAGRVLVGRDLASALQVSPGSRIQLSSCGLAVAGVMDTGGEEDAQILATLEDARRLDPASPAATGLAVHVDGGLDEALSMAKALGAVGIRAEPLFQLATGEAAFVSRAVLLAAALAAVVIVLAALAALTALLAQVAERRHEIALMKALGANESQVAALWRAEGVAMGVAGGLLGFAAGAALGVRMGSSLCGLPAPVPPSLALAAIAGGVLLALLAQAVPLRRVRDVQAAAVLRGD